MSIHWLFTICTSSLTTSGVGITYDSSSISYLATPALPGPSTLSGVPLLLLRSQKGSLSNGQRTEGYFINLNPNLQANMSESLNIVEVHYRGFIPIIVRKDTCICSAIARSSPMFKVLRTTGTDLYPCLDILER